MPFKRKKPLNSTSFRICGLTGLGGGAATTGGGFGRFEPGLKNGFGTTELYKTEHVKHHNQLIRKYLSTPFNITKLKDIIKKQGSR